MNMISVVANNCEIKYPFSGNCNFPGQENRLAIFSQCGQLQKGLLCRSGTVGDSSDMEHSEAVFTKFSYSYEDGRVTVEN
jgi:hypothetical protein